MEPSLFNEEAGKFLIFKLMGEYFAFRAEAVNEIVHSPVITPLPKSKVFVSGVINLRGELIPAVDLRSKIGMPFLKDTKDTVYIKIDIIDEENFYSVGVKVDKVVDVEDFDNISEIVVPESGLLIPQRYLSGAFSYNGDVVFVLNENILFSLEEQGFV